MANPFDVFDDPVAAKATGNPFDSFDAVKSAVPQAENLSDSGSSNGQSEPQFSDGLFGGGPALQPEPLELEAPFEAAASMATGLPNMVAGTAAGAWETLKTSDPKAFDPAREAAMATGPLADIAYEPRSKGGKQIVSVAGTIFGGISDALTTVDSAVQDFTGFPQGGIKTAGEIALLAAGVKGVKGKGKARVEPVKPTPEVPPPAAAPERPVSEAPPGDFPEPPPDLQAQWKTVQDEPPVPEATPSLEPLPEGSPVAEPKVESGIRNAAGNINLDYIRRPQHVQEIIKEAANDIPLERVSNEETIKAAQDLGLTERQLLSRRGQQALNPQQLIAARDLLVSSADRVSEMAKSVVGGSDESVLAFKQALDRHTAIQAQVSGATALAGRALQSFRIGVSTPKALKNALDELGGKASIEDIAQAINDIGEPGQVGNFLQQVGKSGVRRGLVEFWINSILSGPKTHAANVIGNSFTSLLQIPEEAVAAGLQATRAFGKGGEKLTQRGVGARAYGLLSGINDGIRAAGIAFKSEGVETAISKVENTPAIPGKFGKAVRIPGRLLGASDQFFKTINYRAELRSQAANAAKAEKLSGAQLNARIGEILDHPTDEMLTAATRHADYQTFNQAGGPFVQALQQLKSKVPEVSYVLPFIRTPANLLKYALARTPAAALMPSTWAEWASGSAGRARVASRVLTGTALQTWLYTLATDGTITGHGPESRPEKESLMASGWRPYSVKVGDEYVSYQRGDPISYIVGMVADAQNLSQIKGKKELGKAALGALTENLTDKTFFKGITNLAMAIEYKQPEKILENIAGGFIPSALNEVRKQVDPMYRETDGLQDTLMNRVPGLSSKLEPKRDVLGAPVAIDPSVGPDFISPASVSKISKDPVRQLLGQGVSIGKPSNRIKGRGLPPGGIDLDTKEYSWLVRRSGETAEKLLNRIVRNPKFRTLETEQQQTIVDHVFDVSRSPLRAALRIKKVREEKQ